MGLTNHQEVEDFILACQDVDALRVYQHMINERLAMFGDPQQALKDQHVLHQRPQVLLPENAGKR